MSAELSPSSQHVILCTEIVTSPIVRSDLIFLGQEKLFVRSFRNMKFPQALPNFGVGEFFVHFYEQ